MSETTADAVNPDLQETGLLVSGMTCGACAVRLEKALSRAPGIGRASVNFALERADVAFDPRQNNPAQIAEVIRKAGFEPSLVPTTDEGRAEADAQHDEREDAKAKKELFVLRISMALAAPMVGHMIMKFFGSDFTHYPFVEVILATIIQFVIGARFYRAAYNALRAGAANMDVLVVTGTSAAYIYSWYLIGTLGAEARGQLYFEASAVIITLVLLGKYMESRAKRGTTAAIRQLMDLRPQTARKRLADGTEADVPVAEVRAGDVVIVKPGERVPVDGEVVAGQSDMDESLITGESLPVLKQPGDSVTGGAINGTGLLEIVATHIGADSTLSKIIRLVENAQSGKAPVQRLVDQISQVFVPVVVAISIVTFAVWIFLTGQFEPALIAAISVLVIACPCALGLATPTAIMTGTGAAARSGILIKDVESLERAHRLSAVIFDKTGTLTEGKPAVTATFASQGSEADMLRLAAAVQQGSEHPLGRAILDKAGELELSLPAVTDFQSLTGQGVIGWVENQKVAVGNERLLAELNLQPGEELARAREWEAKARTVVWVTAEDRILGMIAIADKIRPEAAESIETLRNLGIRTLMLSGDAELVAAEIGRQAGVDESRGTVQPDEKADAVNALSSEGYIVGMIGDGINDAPALAAADVGIAMGTGTDIAMETASITLMRSDPRLVGAAISASRATFRKIKQNLFWAFIFNIIGIPLAAMGILTPTLAGAAMAMSSVSVVSNSLLLRRWKPAFRR
jgi:Cu+-exporting ATPase